MKRVLLYTMILIIGMALLGCSPEMQEDEPPMNDRGGDIPEQTEDALEEEPLNPDYRILFTDGEVILFAYEDELDLEKIFGTPVTEETEELTNADTFTGSFIKRLSYDETELVLFSPKHDGERFYLLSLSTTAADMKTPRGIGVGDTLSSLQEAYPELARSLDGTTGSDGQYEVRFDEAYTYLHFVVEQDVVVEIRLFHEFA